MLKITQVLMPQQNNNQILYAQPLGMVPASKTSIQLEKVGKVGLVLPFMDAFFTVIHSKEGKLVEKWSLR